jgi:predicted transcriptional regulator
MTTLTIGIASYEHMKARTLAIAAGTHKPSPDEPKIWFPSTESFSKILSEKNRVLLSIIAETHPHSLTELAAETGRKKSNLSRTLKTMANYGLVELRKSKNGTIAPHVPYGAIQLTMSLCKD